MNLFSGLQGASGSGVMPSNVTAYNNTINGTQAQTTNQQQQQQQQYQPGQQALQAALPGLYGNLANGQVPTSFTEPSQVTNYANQLFQQQVEPGLVAEYGAGSPQIAGQQSLMESGLAANLWNSGLSNYTNALNSGSQFALTPTGQSATAGTQGNYNYNQAAAGTQGSGIGSSLIAYLLSALGI